MIAPGNHHLHPVFRVNASDQERGVSIKALDGKAPNLLKGGAGVPKTHGAIGPMKARKERPWHGSRGRLQLLLKDILHVLYDLLVHLFKVCHPREHVANPAH